MVITASDGCYVWDGDGNRYLDFSSQLVNTNIGHQHPRVVAAIADAARTLCTIAPQHANAARGRAAELIAGLAPDGFDQVFFTNAGADAVEHAVRMARLHTGRPKVLSAYRSYHGGTQQAVNITGEPRRWPSDTGTERVVHFHGPFLYRSQFHATTEARECERALEHLESLIEFEGPATIAALILETIPGTSGIMPPPDGYLACVRRICDRHGIVYIADEVMSGFGRSGRWLALDHWGVRPDLITFAKGVTSGYVPLGGVIVSDQVAATFAERVYPGGLTYSGHPLACATAVATIETMRDEGIVDNAAHVGQQVLGPGLHELASRHRSIGQVRGMGVCWAVELVKDRVTKEPMAPYGTTSAAMTALVSECKTRGLLPFTNFNRMHVVPPCIISEADAKEGLAILDDALCVADLHCR
jgi:taurine--2-oxoglutarate transaminase